MKTAVCISGRISHTENVDNLRQHVIEPYKADVFIDTWYPTDSNLNAVVDAYEPKLINIENSESMPLVHQIMSSLPENTTDYNGSEATETKKENVLFMFYKVWKVNQLRKLYEECNRVRYDRIIRMRFDVTFESFPVIEPAPKTVHIPSRGDYRGGVCDMVAVGDSAAIDLYCDLYPNIYRYSIAKIGIHPESLLRKHLEINRLTIERFDCGMKLRGNTV